MPIKRETVFHGRFAFTREKKLRIRMARTEKSVVPFRDFSGAVFFFGFGPAIDPFTLGWAAWRAVGAAVLSLVGVTFAGMILGGREKPSTVASLSTSLDLTICGRDRVASFCYTDAE